MSYHDGAGELRVPLTGEGLGLSEPFDGCPLEIKGLVLVVETEGEFSDDGRTLQAENVKRWWVEATR